MVEGRPPELTTRCCVRSCVNRALECSEREKTLPDCAPHPEQALRLTLLPCSQPRLYLSKPSLWPTKKVKSTFSKRTRHLFAVFFLTRKEKTLKFTVTERNLDSMTKTGNRRRKMMRAPRFSASVRPAATASASSAPPPTTSARCWLSRGCSGRAADPAAPSQTAERGSAAGSGAGARLAAPLAGFSPSGATLQLQSSMQKQGGSMANYMRQKRTVDVLHRREKKKLGKLNFEFSRKIDMLRTKIGRNCEQHLSSSAGL